MKRLYPTLLMSGFRNVLYTNTNPTTLKETCHNSGSDLHFKLTETAPGFVFSRLLTWRPVSGDFGPPLDAKEKLVSS